MSRSKRKITINDIARLSGVSKKTVSRVINDSPKVRERTREKVMAVIEEHGYTPDPQARALALRRSSLIAMVYDNPSPQYVVTMLRGILDVLEGTSFQLVMKPVDRRSDSYRQDVLRFVEQQRIFGAIMPPSVSEDQELIDLVAGAGCRHVRIASVVLDTPENTVKTHDSDGAAQAARHLAELGHRRIAHIRGPKMFRSSHERLRGFKEVLVEYGIKLDSKLILEAGYTFDTGAQRATELLRMKNPPTAIFTGNDEMALGVYNAAQKAGIRIPDDLSVVGFDDTPIASRIWPNLSTVRLPIREMGKAAADLLIRDRQPARSSPLPYVSFSPSLVVRKSTAPPP